MLELRFGGYEDSLCGEILSTLSSLLKLCTQVKKELNNWGMFCET